MLTVFERQALEAVKDGGDVFDRATATVLRGLEPDGFVEICEVMGDYPGEQRQPYFGAIVTRKGKRALANKRVERSWAANRIRQQIQWTS